MAKKRPIKSDLDKIDRHRIAPAEYDDAPEITDRALDNAEIVMDGKVISRGRLTKSRRAKS